VGGPCIGQGIRGCVAGEDVYISPQMERILETVLSPIGLAGLGLVATLVYMVYR